MKQENKAMVVESLEEKMQSPCLKEASRACFNGCCLKKSPPPSLESANSRYSTSTNTSILSHQSFTTATTYSLHPNSQFTNHESLPLLDRSFSNLKKAFPQYDLTNQADQIRAEEYSHLAQSNQVCLDYIGHGLFSYSQQQNQLNVPFFNTMYKAVKLKSQIQYGSAQESEFESITRKRIMKFMNISEDDYSMVFTANHSSAFKTLAESYPFRSNKNVLTVYDHENDAIDEMIDGSRKKGAKVKSAEFHWPNMRIQSRKLKKKLTGKKKMNKGLFVFPLQSKMSGTRYSYLWMSIARENGWHVLLDASSLVAKEMEALGLSLFQPDFLICSFYKVFGDNPSGFGCLFIKKTTSSVLIDSTTSTGNIVSLVRATTEFNFLDKSSSFEVQETKQEEQSLSFSSSTEILQLYKPSYNAAESSSTRRSEIEFNGLDHADSLGLIRISSRVKYLVNWLVNALMSLKHPNSENGISLVRIYGPKIKLDRGPAVAFNIFDWKGEKMDPRLVQKLAGRSNISVSCGVLKNISISDKSEEENEMLSDIRTEKNSMILVRKKREKIDLKIEVITVSLGLLTNFEDTYRLWGFVSRFLDADFVEKERWRYMALNRRTVEV